MSQTKDKLIYDIADAADSDNVGAFIKASDGTHITHTGTSLDVNVTNASIAVTGTVTANVDFDYAEDSAHVSGDTGAFMLAVRNDTQGTLADTDGDYAPLQVDAEGRLRVITDIDVSLTGDLQDDDDVDTQNALKIAFHAFDTSAGALTAVSADGDKADARSDLYRRMFVNTVPNIGIAQEKVTVGATEVSVFTTPLDGRLSVKIRNVSSNPVWLGPTGVTTSGATEGHKLEKGAILEWDLGRGIDLFAIAAGAGNDIVVTQLA